MKGHTYKTTAVALQSRRLVRISKKGGVWQAELTEAGTHYLRHGSHLARLRPAASRSVSAPTPSVRAVHRPHDATVSMSLPDQQPRSPAGPSQADLARQLVTRVIEAGGVLEASADEGRKHYEQLIAASRRAPNLPFGKQLRIRSAGPYWSGRHEIYADEDFSVRVAAAPVPVPRRVAAYHPVVAAYRADPDWQEVSRQSLGRASRILQAIAAEATRRGYTIAQGGQRRGSQGLARSLKDGQFQVSIDGFAYRLRIREHSAPGGGPMPYMANQSIPLWRRTRRTEFVPTGSSYSPRVIERAVVS